VERRRSRPRRTLAPQLIDQRVRRDDATGVQEQDREQRALLLPAERYLCAVDGDFERPQYAELNRQDLVVTPVKRLA
jgi:hypothetical protein